MGCPLAKETALSCIQIRYKRMPSVNKAKNNRNEHVENWYETTSHKTSNINSFRTRLIGFPILGWPPWHVHARATFLVNLNISYPKLSGRDFAPQSLYNLSGNKYIEIAFYVSVKFCTLWVQRERVGGGGRAVSSDILEGGGLLTNRIESFLITRIELNSKFQTPNSFKASFEESKDVLELNWYPF